jgi:hypothetical protein
MTGSAGSPQRSRPLSRLIPTPCATLSSANFLRSLAAAMTRPSSVRSSPDAPRAAWRPRADQPCRRSQAVAHPSHCTRRAARASPPTPAGIGRGWCETPGQRPARDLWAIALRSRTPPPVPCPATGRNGPAVPRPRGWPGRPLVAGQSLTAKDLRARPVVRAGRTRQERLRRRLRRSSSLDRTCPQSGDRGYWEPWEDQARTG